MTTQKKILLNDEIDRFIFRWDSMIIDYWWRKRYNVPFGSPTHRDMNFIDMLIEYREQLNSMKQGKKKEDISGEYDNTIRMTDEEIDEEYENLDLTKF